MNPVCNHRDNVALLRQHPYLYASWNGQVRRRWIVVVVLIALCDWLGIYKIDHFVQASLRDYHSMFLADMRWQCVEIRDDTIDQAVLETNVSLQDQQKCEEIWRADSPRVVSHKDGATFVINETTYQAPYQQHEADLRRQAEQLGLPFFVLQALTTQWMHALEGSLIVQGHLAYFLQETFDLNLVLITQGRCERSLQSVDENTFCFSLRQELWPPDSPVWICLGEYTLKKDQSGSWKLQHESTSFAYELI